ncbi:hypothetical protein GJ496_004366 [Pomphorhynchus laevis]|nr:hypothetical protein GJ496_004366 [Pomphorhynchus laevis]
MANMDIQSAKLIWFSCLANFINAADRAIFPIAIISMSKSFSWSLFYQGWLFSGFSFGYVISQLFADKTAKLFGARSLLFATVLFWSILFTLVPIVASYQEVLMHSTYIPCISRVPMLIMRILLGFGEGFALPTIYHLYAQSLHPSVKARAFGYLSASASIGQTLAAIITPHVSWKLMFIVFGISGIFWSGIWLKYSFYNIQEETRVSSGLTHHATTKVKIPFIKFLTSRPSIAIYVAHFSMNYSSYIIAVWFPTVLKKHFSANPTDLSFTALPYICHSLCGIVVGHLADYIINKHQCSQLSMRRIMTFFGLFCPGILLLMFTTVHGIHSAVFLISLSMGLLSLNSVGHLSNHVDIAPSNAALSFAISNTIATIPAILTGPLSAHLVSASHGSWYPVFVIAALVNLVGSLIYITISSIKPI